MDAIQEIFILYKLYGDIEYGESVTQLEHMSQCAQLAIEEGYEDEIVLAAFFHDLGHFLPDQTDIMEDLGNADHEFLGAQFLLKRGFSRKIAALVASHVQAKRYLVYKDPKYYLELSEASKNTLKFQGGPMSYAEALKFERKELFLLYLKLREWDDRAKVVGLPIIDLSKIKEMCENHLTNRKNPELIF